MDRKQKLRRQRIADKICVRCGINPPKPGTKQCQACLDYNKEHRNDSAAANRKQNIKEARKKFGVCVYCGNLPLPNKIACQICYDHRKKYSETSRQKRKDLHLCTRCGKNNKYQTYRICQECRKKEQKIKRDNYINLGLCRTCGKNKIKNNDSTLCELCSIRLKNNNKKRNIKRWNQILSHYGKKCACCGESDERFLTIDHICNDGATHKKAIGKNSSAIRRWIINNNYPNTIQILCYNCNCAKGKYGSCPHQWS